MTNAYIHAEEIESTIALGYDNMLAAYVKIATGDKHPIFDLENLNRLNKTRNIVTGSHVWLANGVQLLKGAAVGDHCVVGMHTTITNAITKQNDVKSDELAHHAVIYGSPPQVQNTGTSWSREMFFDIADKQMNKYPDAATQSWFHRGHMLTRFASEELAQGKISPAITIFRQSIDAYRRAIEYKHDFAYAYSALGLTEIRLAEAAFSLGDVTLTSEMLERAIGYLQDGLSYHPGHSDSLKRKTDALRALEELKRAVPDTDNDSLNLVSLARIHLIFFSFEYDLLNRDLAEIQLNYAEEKLTCIKTQARENLDEFSKEVAYAKQQLIAEWTT
jgi:tetratricopeptide (TPR) repeat protein